MPNDIDRVPLTIKYTNFTNTYTTGTGNKNFTYNDLNFKIPKGYLPVGITRFYSGTQRVVMRGIEPYGGGNFINIDGDLSSDNVVLMRCLDSSVTSDITLNLTFACIPVEYLDTHLCEYELWPAENS